MTAGAAAMSLLIHGGALALLIPHGAAPAAAVQEPIFEVELIDRQDQQRGTPDRQAVEAALPTPPRDAGERFEPPRPPPSRYAVNLGGAAQDVAGLITSGTNVVPPRPDARAGNKPPPYPPEAARRRIQGVVGLLVHVSATGLPAAVEIIASSGSVLLDRTARDAIATWRFQPARNESGPIPFDFNYNIRFTLGAAP